MRSRVDTESVCLYVRVVKNITITMPDDLARKVRVMAAEADTSMSQFLCRLVEEKTVADDTYQAAMKRWLTRERGGLRLDGQKLPTRNEIHDRNALR
jgi:predicted transcriptional regulator